MLYEHSELHPHSACSCGPADSLQMNVTTRHIEPQTSQCAAVRKLFPGQLTQKYLEFTKHNMK